MLIMLKLLYLHRLSLIYYFSFCSVMIQTVYYVVVYTSQGVPASVYRRVFSDSVIADLFAKRSLNPERKSVYNTVSFDGYFVRQFSITDNLKPFPF